MKYCVGNRNFRTKKELRNLCWGIAAFTSDGEIIETESDLEFLFDLFQYDDEWVDKSVGGVQAIRTQTNDYGTSYFVLMKTNGDHVPISYSRIINNMLSREALPLYLRDFKNAARYAIWQQLQDFRDRILRVDSKCPITDEALTRDNCSINHIHPHTFHKLLWDFCLSRLVVPSNIDLVPDKDNIQSFRDKDLEGGWQDYHQEHAKLRLISRHGKSKLPKVKLQWEDLEMLG